MSIDPRLRERREAVAEDRAQRNVGRLLKFLIVVTLIGAIVWLAFSPWLSINQVRTAGISVSGANTILADNGVLAGAPMVMVRPGVIESEMLEDPWISDARVHVDWPNVVIVGVVERVPVAWVQTADGWTRRSVDGARLPSGNQPDDSLPKVILPDVGGIDASSSQLVLGSVEFFDALPTHLWASSSIRFESGELWATVEGYGIRLGRPVEMAVKASTLVVMLEEPIPQNALIVLIAPTHPAINSQPIDPNSEQLGDQSG
jgi:cell division protein FtsQ